MKTPLDINLLIDKAQQLVHDGKIDFAHSGEIPVQLLEAGDGTKYLLKLVMTAHPETTTRQWASGIHPVSDCMDDCD